MTIIHPWLFSILTWPFLLFYLTVVLLILFIVLRLEVLIFHLIHCCVLNSIHCPLHFDYVFAFPFHLTCDGISALSQLPGCDLLLNRRLLPVLLYSSFYAADVVCVRWPGIASLHCLRAFRAFPHSYLAVYSASLPFLNHSLPGSSTVDMLLLVARGCGMHPATISCSPIPGVCEYSRHKTRVLSLCRISVPPRIQLTNTVNSLEDRRSLAISSGL